VTDKGAKSFMLATRYPGSSNPARRSLGTYGELTLEQARTKARRWLDLVRRGLDPTEQEERERLAEQRKRSNLFASVAEDFIREKLSTERKGREVERDLRREFTSAWGGRPITEITSLDVLEIIRAKKDTPYQAHNLLGTIKRFFSWAIDQQVYAIEASPCDRLKPKKIIGERKPRQRVLSDDELRAFWRATGRLPYPFGPLGRLLLLTGMRHDEAAGGRWGEIDLDAGRWTVPPPRHKSETGHLVPLVDDVVAKLRDLPRFKRGDFVFTATWGEKSTWFSDKMKKKLDGRMLRTLKAMARKSGKDPGRVTLDPWVFHDLRRTVRTHLSALRIVDPVAEMVIGHGKKGLQRIYDQHKYETEMREALTLWANRLHSIVEPPPANVVPITGQRDDYSAVIR
jgi:integrase